MKNILLIILAGLFLLTACESRYLDLEPLDKVTEATYFSQPEHFRAASNSFYTKLLGWRTVDNRNIYDYMDWGSDLTSIATAYGRGTVVTGSNDAYWTGAYKYIRANNILISKAEEYPGDQSEIAQYVAVAKFCRAYHHLFLLQRFGGVPIVTTVLDLNSEQLTGKRNSRYEVFAQVKKDLEEAIVDLPTSIEPSLKGQISKWAAESLLAKALLFEGTFEKYVETTTDGDGTSEGAGSAKPESYPSISEMFAQAKDLAKDVMDNGGFELWNHNSELNNQSMYFLFNLEDAGSNPIGLTKASNKEYIFFSKYDYDLYQGQKNLTHSSYHWGPSRKMMDMFLCSDGLPVDKSPLFKGYEKVSDEYQNRDYRLLAYVGDENGNAPEDGSVVLSGAGAGSIGGYGSKKFGSYNYGVYRAAATESYDYPHIRLAEVYLIYAEALYELNVSITDAEMDESINKVKARSGLPALTNAFAAANGLDILFEIRRERAIELHAENNRFNDLIRWGMAEEELNQDMCGVVIEGTDFENDPELYKPSKYPYGETVVKTGVGDRRVLVIDPASNKNFKRMHYLMPIPLEEMNLNENLVQNPGY